MSICQKNCRPVWAAKILIVVLDLVPATEEVEILLNIVNDPTKWQEAYQAFQTIRKVTLRLKQGLYVDVLTLAENVAKVTYNASGQPAPFDYNSGWKIGKNLRAIVNQVNDPKFSDTAWLYLSDLDVE